jgi:hypothetical protein
VEAAFRRERWRAFVQDLRKGWWLSIFVAILAVAILMSALGPPAFQREVNAEVIGIGTRAHETGDWPRIDVRTEDGAFLRIAAPRGIVIPVGSDVVVAHYSHSWPWRRDTYRFVRLAQREPRER